MTPNPPGTECAALLLDCAEYLCQCAWSQIYELAQSPNDFVIICVDSESEWFVRTKGPSEEEGICIGPISRESFLGIAPELPLRPGEDPAALLAQATDHRVLALVVAKSGECALYYMIPRCARELVH